MTDAVLDSGQYRDEPLVTGDVYEVRVLRTPRIADNMQFIWNYAVINLKTGVTEIHTDTEPGAIQMFLKFEAGYAAVQDELGKYLKQKAGRERHRSTH